LDEIVSLIEDNFQLKLWFILNIQFLIEEIVFFKQSG